MDKPEKKSKRDGHLTLTRSHWNLAALTMVGDYTAEQILDKAIAKGDIPHNERDAWENLGEYGRYYQAWFKAVPDGSGEFSTYYHETIKTTRGAFFVSVLERF